MEKSTRRTLATLALFVGSGCAALIYEVVWFHMLSLVVGASSISLALLLSSFMGGMCLGSMAFPRFFPMTRQPLQVYAALELLIAFFGLAILWLLPAIGQVYWAYAGYGFAGMALRSILAIVILLPPTVLMGATLPAVARGVQATRAGLSRLGFAYGANTFGAVIGSLLTGFYLLRAHDVTIATLTAVALNVLVAAVAFLLARRTETDPVPVIKRSPVAATGSVPWAVYLVIGLSGLTALGAEVVWTRLLSVLFGPTVYTFSIILAVFLCGIGIGSGCGSVMSRTLRRPGRALATCQLLLAITIPISAWMIVAVVPHWLSTRDPQLGLGGRMAFDLLRASLALLPPALLWGASFPLAVAAAAKGQKDTGHLVGHVYGANTIGAIVGSAWAGFVGIPFLGSQVSQQVLTLLAAGSALIMFGSLSLPRLRYGFKLRMEIFRSRPIAAGLTVVALLVVIASPAAALFVPAIPVGMLAYGRNQTIWNFPARYLSVTEGLDSAVAVSVDPDGIRSFHVSGKVVASSLARDMHTERMLGHVPAMLHPGPRSVLVVGCGAGVTAGSLTLYPTVERIVICDIESAVPRTAGRFFAAENNGVIDDPRTEVVIDDARHFLAATDEKFDVITTDPIHPWVRGAAALYTTEFFELCKKHLNPEGVVTQWVPLYESNEAAVKCELATFIRSFPDATLWSNDRTGRGYDLTVVGSLEGEPVNVLRMRRHYQSNPALQRSLAEVDLSSTEALLRTFVASGPAVADWLRDAEINRDCNLRLQYLAGLSLDNQTQHDIFRAMVANRHPVSNTASALRAPLAN